jgi:hypothetical protein
MEGWRIGIGQAMGRAHSTIHGWLIAAGGFAPACRSGRQRRYRCTNGIAAAVLPQRQVDSHITQEQLDQVAAELNGRPHETLSFKTPAEVLFKTVASTGDTNGVGHPTSTARRQPTAIARFAMAQLLTG